MSYAMPMLVPAPFASRSRMCSRLRSLTTAWDSLLNTMQAWDSSRCVNGQQRLEGHASSSQQKARARVGWSSFLFQRWNDVDALPVLITDVHPLFLTRMRAFLTA